MSLSTPFIRRPVATSLLMAAFVLVGLAAYPFLPVAPLPRVDFPIINVVARFPGAVVGQSHKEYDIGRKYFSIPIGRRIR